MRYDVKKIIKEYKEKRTFVFSSLSCIYDLIWSIIQLVISLVSKNEYLLVSASYTFLMFIAKALCDLGIMSKSVKKENYYTIIASCLIMLSGIYYFNLMTRKFFGETGIAFNTGLGRLIIIFSITSFVFAIISIFFSKGTSKSYKIIKIISICKAIISISLTQMAIVVLKFPNIDETYNFIIGIVFGVLTFILGLVCLIRNFTISSISKKRG